MPVDAHAVRYAKGSAVLALAVWLVGGELVPGLHVAFHARLPEHHHDGDPLPTAAQIARARWSPHAHGHAAGHAHDHLHDHVHPHRGHPPAPGVVGWVAPPSPGHGLHALAHRTLAIPVAAPARWVVPPPIRVPLGEVRRPPDTWQETHVARPRARSPPNRVG